MCTVLSIWEMNSIDKLLMAQCIVIIKLRAIEVTSDLANTMCDFLLSAQASWHC